MSAPPSGSSSGNPGAGFYPDPSIPGYIRYWNGMAWVPGTSRPEPRDGEPLPAPPPGAIAPPPVVPPPASESAAGYVAEPAAEPEEETGPVFLDGDPQDEPPSGGYGGAVEPGRRDQDGSPSSAAPMIGWSDPRRLPGARPEPAASWQPEPSQSGGPASGPAPAAGPGRTSGPAPASAAGRAPGPRPGAGSEDSASGSGAGSGVPASGSGTMVLRAQPPADSGPPASRDARQTGGYATAPGHGSASRDGREGGGSAASAASAAPGSPGPRHAAGPHLPPQQGTPAQLPAQGAPGRGAPPASPATAAPSAAAPGTGRPAEWDRSVEPGRAPFPAAAPQAHTPQAPAPATGHPAPPAAGGGGQQPPWAQQVRDLAQQAPDRSGAGHRPGAGSAPGQPLGPGPVGGGSGFWRPPAADPFEAARAQSRPAALGRRLVARLVDAVVVLGATSAVAAPFVGDTVDHIEQKVDAVEQAGVTGNVWLIDGTTGGYLAVVLAAFLLFGLVYEALPTARWGRTFGKKLCGLMVLDIERQDTPSSGAALRRWLTCNVLFAIAIGVVNVLWCVFDRPWRQCWHDKVAGTFVTGDSHELRL